METQKVNKGIIGIVCAFIGWFAFGLPLSILAVGLGLSDKPKTTWSYISIIAGVVELVIILSWLAQ
jgi:hypothetical protein